jgi:hypothetical protein
MLARTAIGIVTSSLAAYLNARTPSVQGSPVAEATQIKDMRSIDVYDFTLIGTAPCRGITADITACKLDLHLWLRF